MKRFLIIVALSILSCLGIESYAQSVPNTFYGIKLGEKVTKEKISAKIGKPAAAEEDMVYTVADVEFNGKKWDRVTFVSNQDGQLMAVFFSHHTEYDIETPDDVLVKDPEYLRLIEALGPAEQLVSDPDGVTPTLVSLPDMTSMTLAGVQFQNDKTEDGTLVKAIALIYSDLQLMMGFTQTLIDEELPEVQDTFFGLKFGSRPTMSQVKTAVGSRGSFLESGDPAAPEYTFSDVYYAGKRWKYAVFSITPNGQFYQFSAYDTYPDNSWNTDERQMANSTFEDMKGRLDSKYGEAETQKDEDGVHASYIGKRKVCARLSNERGISKGGEYRRYVKISYFDYNLMSEASSSIDDEL